MTATSKLTHQLSTASEPLLSTNWLSVAHNCQLTQSQSYHDQGSIGQSETRFLLLSDCCRIVGDLQLLLVWPAQPFLAPSTTGLMTIYYCLRFRLPNLEGQVPLFISPRTGRPTLTLRLFVPFLSPPKTQECYSADIQTCFHAGIPLTGNLLWLYSLGMDCIENIVLSSSGIVFRAIFMHRIV
jgi:hypothetical protein